MTAGTDISIQMATVSVPGPASASNVCSPAGPQPWVSGATAVRPRTAHTADFSARAAMSKACSSCGFKAMEQWVSQQSHILADCDWQHITFTMSHLLWPIFNNNWSLLNALFRVAHGLSPAGPANRAWMWVFSVRCTPTVASSTSIHIFTCPTPAADSISRMMSGGSSFLRSTRGSNLARSRHQTACHSYSRFFWPPAGVELYQC